VTRLGRSTLLLNSKAPEQMTSLFKTTVKLSEDIHVGVLSEIR